MLFCSNETNFELDEQFLHKIADELGSEDVELVLSTDEGIQEINRQTRDKNESTDVLSFPLEVMPHSPLGSIVINLDLARRISKEFGHSLQEEISLLFIHGYLHLKGYDHENDEGQMRKKEQELMKRFILPKSLIARNE